MYRSTPCSISQTTNSRDSQLCGSNSLSKRNTTEWTTGGGHKYGMIQVVNAASRYDTVLFESIHAASEKALYSTVFPWSYGRQDARSDAAATVLHVQHAQLFLD